MTNSLLFCQEYFIEKEAPNLGSQNTFISISSNEARIFVSFFNLLHFSDLCDKGKSSADGFDNPNHDACKLCSVGFYQDKYGATSCMQCPSGLTTLTKGSITQNDCGSMCRYVPFFQVICDVTAGAWGKKF